MLCFILDSKNISTLQKSLILCADVLCWEQKYNAFKINCNICDTLENILCCPLFKESKIQFIIMIILFPLIIVVYLLVVVLILGFTIATFGGCLCGIGEKGCACTLTWPCTLCGCNLYWFNCVFPSCMK